MKKVGGMSSFSAIICQLLNINDGIASVMDQPAVVANAFDDDGVGRGVVRSIKIEVDVTVVVGYCVGFPIDGRPQIGFRAIDAFRGVVFG